jgi:hypothetical protein
MVIGRGLLFWGSALRFGLAKPRDWPEGILAYNYNEWRLGHHQGVAATCFHRVQNRCPRSRRNHLPALGDTAAFQDPDNRLASQYAAFWQRRPEIKDGGT